MEGFLEDSKLDVAGRKLEPLLPTVPSLIPPSTLRNFPTAGRYLVGLSGGRDSVALLNALIESGYGNLVICHLNHRLRGRSSEADAKFARRVAEKHNLKFVLKAVDVKRLGRKRKNSIEAAGREARYAFYAQAAARCNCRTIFLGHHADDLVETFLINLFRGAGLTGLSAMREIS
jgi:tRNA(Ile)-lysidine synthase